MSDGYDAADNGKRCYDEGIAAMRAKHLGVERVVHIGNHELILGDCLEVMPKLGKFDAVVTDPPFFKVKPDGWDRQWSDRHGFYDWAEDAISLIADHLNGNGSLYWFAWPDHAGMIEARASNHLQVLNHIVWRKGKAGKSCLSRGNQSSKEALREFFPTSERIIFAGHYGADDGAMGLSGYADKCDEAARKTFGSYIKKIRLDHDLSSKQLTEVVGAYGRVNHGGACSNWEKGYNVPTQEHYQKIRLKWPGYFFKEYEELRAEYEELRAEYEELRRPFNIRKGAQWSDVWDFDPVSGYLGKHPCEKPIALMAHILECSTKPSHTILDPFMGSGTTGVACEQLGRHFTGIELDPDYFEIAVKRVREAYAQPTLFEAEPKPKPPENGNLFTD